MLISLSKLLQQQTDSVLIQIQGSHRDLKALGDRPLPHTVVDVFTEPEKRLFKTRVAFANPMSRSNFQTAAIYP